MLGFSTATDFARAFLALAVFAPSFTRSGNHLENPGLPELLRPLRERRAYYCLKTRKCAEMEEMTGGEQGSGS